MPNVLGLIDLILTFPASTSECERGFSGMKRVKSDWRARLNTSTLSDLLLVLLEGPSIDDFEPLRACQLTIMTGGQLNEAPTGKSGHGKKRKTHQIQLPLLVVLLPLPLLILLLLKTTLKLGLSRWWRK